MRNWIGIIATIVLLGIASVSEAQNRIRTLENTLKSMVADNPGLESMVDLSVTDVTLQEFLRAIAITNDLNISVDEKLDMKVVNTFSKVSVVDVLVFLSKEYDLQIDFVGNILSVSKFEAPPEQPKAYVPKKIDVKFNNRDKNLSYNLKNDSLFLVAREITKVSGRNLVLAPELQSKLVSGFVKDLPFVGGIEKLAFSNGMEFSEEQDGSVLLTLKAEEVGDQKATTNRRTKDRNSRNRSNKGDQASQLFVDIKDSLLSVDGVGVTGSEIINLVSAEADKNYFLFTPMDAPATLTLEDVTYDQFLSYLLNGTELTYKKEGGIYLIGSRNLERLRQTKVVKFQNRRVEGIEEFIPTEMKQGVTLKIMDELNSIILSGSGPQIQEITAFLKDMDQVVPMVMIEVIIVDVNRSRIDEAGLDIGIGEAPATTGGTILSGLDMTINSQSLNGVLSAISGLGSFNLGQVTPNFYVSMRALEEQGFLRSRSTPMLSTLNGHEATMTIGNTQYYQETTNSVIGTQNPQNVFTQRFSAVNADLTLNITPTVSGDGHVTMDISVQQSDFTSRISPNAPPGQVTRDFKSLIRVKDQDMILLGGLEEKSTSDNGRGWPILSRIPVLKWLFSTRKRRKEKTKLNIFIKPTIVY